MLDYTLNNSLATQLYQPETLQAAWRKVRANKGAPGSDGVTIQQFEVDLTKHLRQLSREISEERYYPLPVQQFTIKKSSHLPPFFFGFRIWLVLLGLCVRKSVNNWCPKVDRLYGVYL